MGQEDVLLIRVEKFMENIKEKHSVLSSVYLKSMDKIIDCLRQYLIDDPIIDRIYELIYWAESHDNFSEIEAKFRYLADTFWDWGVDDEC